MDIEDTTTDKLRTDTESIKLFKNTKGYNWEIKIIGLDIDKLTKIDSELHKRFDMGE